MSEDDDLEIMDEEEQTLILDEGEEDGQETEDADGEAFAIEDDEMAVEDEEFGEEAEGLDDDNIRPPKFKPDSNVYTVLMALSCIAYAATLYVVLTELYQYCDPDKFLWGLLKK